MFTLPVFMLSALIEQMGRLQATEARVWATIALLPHMKTADRTRVLWRWERAMQRAPTKAPVEVVEVNPEKARAYFAALGAKVVTDG